jgi:hypothetical protein
MKLFKLLIERLPKLQSILGVYAVIVFLVYSWTLFTSFYKLPSWMFYLTISQILSVYAYAFSVDLAESVLVLAGILLLEFTFFFILRNKEEIQSRSILIALVLLLPSMWRLFLFQGYEDSAAFVGGELKWWILTLAIGFPLAALIPKNYWLRRILEGFAERAAVFLYIYLPLSFVSLIVVIARNIY